MSTSSSRYDTLFYIFPDGLIWYSDRVGLSSTVSVGSVLLYVTGFDIKTLDGRFATQTSKSMPVGRPVTKYMGYVKMFITDESLRLTAEALSDFMY